MSEVWRSSGSRPPSPPRSSFGAAPGFDIARGFKLGDLITFSGATVCRSLDLPAYQKSRGRPEGDPKLSNEPPKLGIWLGLVTYKEQLGTWDVDNRHWVMTGQTKHHVYHVVLTSVGLLYVYENEARRPGMKLVTSPA